MTKVMDINLELTPMLTLPLTTPILNLLPFFGKNVDDGGFENHIMIRE